VAHLCGDPHLPFNYNKNQNNYHEYQDSTEMCKRSQSPACTVENVFNTLLHTPAAIAPVISTVQAKDIQSCRVLELRSCPGSDNDIRIVIDPAQDSVTNYTLPDHIFYPGEVMRRIVDHSGAIEIETIGKGVGCKKAENIEGATCKIWPDADQALRVAVWKELNLGVPPPVPTNSIACYGILSFIMWTCDLKELAR
jgi:hypothetical protein